MRSLNELIDGLNEQSGMRKHELIALQSKYGSATGKFKDVLGRVIIVMTYAHWEGAVKQMAVCYLDYVRFKSTPLSHLEFPFQALAIRVPLSLAEKSVRSINKHLEVVDIIRNIRSSSSSINPSLSIDTESNLDWCVFENICVSLGIHLDDSWTGRGPMINEMVKLRCEIAHGVLVNVNEKQVYEVLEFGIWGIDQFSMIIQNSAAAKSHLLEPYR